jgi:excisionase family DNA binding protein
VYVLTVWFSYTQMLPSASMESKETNPDSFLTVDQAAQLVALSHWTIRAWLHKGRLTRYKSGPSRTVVSRLELLELVKPTKARN